VYACIQNVRKSTLLKHIADGFILGDNKWDSLQIDALVLSAIDDKAKERLGDAGYFG